MKNFPLLPYSMQQRVQLSPLCGGGVRQEINRKEEREWK